MVVKESQKQVLDKLVEAMTKIIKPPEKPKEEQGDKRKQEGTQK